MILSAAVCRSGLCLRKLLAPESLSVRIPLFRRGWDVLGGCSTSLEAQQEFEGPSDQRFGKGQVFSVDELWGQLGLR